MHLTYPWFLLGLLAVAIPIIIHLLQLRRPQRVLFTNTGFIKEVELITVRQRKLQHLLVLLSRVLAVAALVLVFCQPFIPAREEGRIGNGAGVDVLVDSSPSMQAAGTAPGTLFAGAITEARELGKVYPTSARFRLLNQAKARLTPTAYQAKLDALTITQASTLTKLNSESQQLEGSANPLYILSDFQKSEFASKVVKGFGNSREVVLVPQVAKPAGNVYVDSVWIDDAFVRLKTNIGLHIRLRNGGSVAATDCPVKVFLNDRQVAAFRVTVEPGQAVASLVQVQVVDNRLALGRVVTEDVPVTFDNTYYFTLQPAAAIPILEIGAEPVAQRLYSNEPLFNYSFTKPQSLNYAELRKANLVLVREVERLDAGLQDALQAVVKRGGSVVIVPSVLVAGQSSYQQFFKKLGLGAAQWEKPAAGPAELREVALPSPQEPFFRDVFGAQQRSVTMPRVAPVLRWPRTGTDIMRMRDGESYLAEFSSGTGRVYVFSAPFSKEYSDFTSHALFVPVLYRMAMLSYRNEQLPAYRLTQATVPLALPAATTAGTRGQGDEASLRLVKDSLTLIPIQRVQGQEVRLDVPIGMNEPGFYQVQRRGRVLTTLAFNQAKRESELAAYSAEELRQAIGPEQKNVRVLEGGTVGAALAKFRAEQTGQPLWRYFLLLALACLLAEALLIRFGSRKAAKKPVVA
jgi:hypothetical protein